MSIKSKRDFNGAHWRALTLYFCIANCFLLLNRGVYWDGWPLSIQIRTSSFGSLWWGYSQAVHFHHLTLLTFLGRYDNFLVAGRFLSFLGLFIFVIGFWTLLRKLKLNASSALIAAALVATFPNYLVAVELVVFQYNVSLGFFGLGMLTYLSYVEMDSVASRRVLAFWAVFSFYVSFGLMNSGLVIYYLFVSVVAWIRLGAVRRLPTDRLLDVVFWGFPLVFWVTRGEPSGLYAGYNKISLSPELLVHGYWAALVTFFRQIFPAALIPKSIVQTAIAVVATTIIGNALSWHAHEPASEPEAEGSPLTRPRLLLLAAGLTGSAAVLPYVVVSKFPGISDWNSRYTIFLAAAQGMFLAAVWQLGRRWRFQRVLQGLILMLLGLHAARAVENYRGWDLDWYKQKAISCQLSEIPAVRDASIVKFENLYDTVDQLGRHIRFYEYSGMLFEAFGQTSRIGLGVTESVPKWAFSSLPEDRKMAAFYGSSALLQDVRSKSVPSVSVIVRPGSQRVSTWSDYLSVKWEELRRPERLCEKVRQLVSVTVAPENS